MAAFFSYQDQIPPSFEDLSTLLPLPNSPIMISGLMEECYINSFSNSLPYSSPREHFQQISSETQRTDSLSIIVNLEGTRNQVTQAVAKMEHNRRKNSDGSSFSSAASKDTEGTKRKKQIKCSDNSKQREKKKNQKKNGYVHHVRARRGEATDSHSLAERVRREKINEKLKLLQSLVPGCDKVTSKALMLDEIINYVQSLQHQVEFLSMKFAGTMAPMDYDLDGHAIISLVNKPEELSSSLESPPVPEVHHQSLLTSSSTTIADITNPCTTNYYPLIENSPSYLLEQEQRPSVYYQDNGDLLWNVGEERQSFFNQSDKDFSTLCSLQ